ncbi:unnamed protein product [Durusdinium trenchii]|uniref:Uncharacterized protein n=1 Tax=Durusdinium trenchii TaxID=1381693 RepID=A0ABP0HLR9_9DINO
MDRLAATAAVEKLRGQHRPITMSMPTAPQNGIPANRMSPYAAAPGCYMLAPGSIAVEPWSHKPNLMQRNEAERVRKREEAFQARRLAALQAKKEAELEKSLKERQEVLAALKKKPTLTEKEPQSPQEEPQEPTEAGVE